MTSPTSPTSRRSHTKSHDGCATCKRRHLRCDETLPQCKNCIKYNCRCPYLHLPENNQGESIRTKANLMWTSEVEADVRSLKQTGQSLFLSLHVFPAIPFENFSLEDLRLIHHVASISNELSARNRSNFTIWVKQVPLFLKIGATYSFVMHSLLALSASHLAWLTRCPLTSTIAFEHRGIALQGLRYAIGSFQSENSDAVLAASLLLSWQTTEWRDWTQLMYGTSSIIDAMRPWKKESQFKDFIAKTRLIPHIPPSPNAPFNNPKHADLDALRLASVQLREVEAYLEGNMEGTKAITQLINFVEGLRTLSPSHTTTQRFDMLDRLRKRLLWLPIMYLQQAQMPLSAFIVLAYYYTIALIVEPLSPETGAAYLGSLSLNPIEEIARRLVSLMNNSCRISQEDLQTALSLMAYPLDIAHEFRLRMGLVLPNRMVLLGEVIRAYDVRAIGRSMS